MARELPLFPLNIVPFPGESINLHIFEPRYKQLISDCLKNNSTFGIASYVLNKIELGVEVKVNEVFRYYSDGRMDIQTMGLSVFIISDFQGKWNGKLYGGGQIEGKGNIADGDLHMQMVFKELCMKLFDWLGEVNIPDLSEVRSVFDLGHKIGLKAEEEYELLKMTRESERLAFAIGHLQRLVPALERAQYAREKIKQNGHFKHLDPLNL